MSKDVRPQATLDLLESILDNIASVVVVKDRSGVIRYGNANYAALHGMAVRELVGRTEWEFMAAQTAQRFHEDDVAVMEADAARQYEEEVPTPTGIRHFRTVKLPLHDSSGRVWGVCAIATDITPERRLEQALRASRDQLRKLAEWAPGMVYQFRRRDDGGYDIPYTSPGIRAVFGLEPEDVAQDASAIFARIHPEDLASVIASIEESGLAGALWSQEFRVVLPSGIRWVRAASTPERIPGATVWHGFAEDVTQRKMSEAAIWQRANFDSVTGLPNRDLCLDRLAQSLRISQRDRTEVAVLFCDLNGFKEVNDRYGHTVGDEVLAQVGSRLVGCVRDADTVARFGGDEFLVVLSDLVDPSGPGRVTASIDRVMRSAFETERGPVHLAGVSIGVALYPEDGLDAVTLVRTADARMYQVKP